jgi:hypothetical protein
MKRAALAALLASGASAAACVGPFSVGADGQFVDACGRARLFRGLNFTRIPFMSTIRTSQLSV